jgi:AcrR family transcriptional regulator
VRGPKGRRVKGQLQETAFTLFLESGFEAVSVDQVALRAGVSGRTFFRYFPNKEEVLLEWLDHYEPTIYDAIKSAPSELTPFETVRHALKAAAGLGRSDPEEQRRNSLVATLALTSPRLRAGLTERQRRWERQIARLLAVRMQVSVEEDLRPNLLAAVALTCAFTTLNWNLGVRRFSDVASQNPDSAFFAMAEMACGLRHK